MFEINKLRPIPWNAIITAELLGGLQTVTGIAMISTGYGSAFGMGLI
jgi:hypothetical protein